MVLVLLFTAAVVLGALVARWWLLSVPVLLLIFVGGLLVAGQPVDRDNPLAFLAVLLELGLAAGIAGRRFAAHSPAR